MVSETGALWVKGGVVAARRLGRACRRQAWRLWPARLRRPFEVVARLDAWDYRAALVADLSALLADHGIEHLILDQRVLATPEIVVDAADAVRVRQELARDDRSAAWWVGLSHLGPVGYPLPARWRGWPLLGASGLMVCRNLVSADGRPLLNSEVGVRVQFWNRLATDSPSVGGGQHPRGTLMSGEHNGVLSYADPQLWRTVQENGHRLPETPPHLLLVHEPIDVVYTWVDGDDPAWQRRKAVALGRTVGNFTDDAEVQARFESRDELRYSLRSIELFANWVNHIWIVTDQQRPSWLREDERLTVVDHREIFADTAVLPVFNSHAIESQLHHIAGLADRYLYFNDDMLLGSLTAPEDFFHGNRIHKFFTSPALIDTGPHDPADLAVSAAAKNNRDFFEAGHGLTVNNKLRHTPQAQSRSLMEQFEADHQDLFNQVMRSRLRQNTDYSITSSLSQYYGFTQRRAVPGNIANGYVDLASPHAEYQLELWLRDQNKRCLCINDSGIEDRLRVDAYLHRFFENYYPLPSRWEA